MSNKYQSAIAEIKRAQKRIKTAKKTLDKSDAVLTKSARLLKEKGVRPYRRRLTTTMPDQKTVAIM